MKTLAELVHAVTGTQRSKVTLHLMEKDDAGAELAKTCASILMNDTTCRNPTSTNDMEGISIAIE